MNVSSSGPSIAPRRLYISSYSIRPLTDTVCQITVEVQDAQSVDTNCIQCLFGLRLLLHVSI